MSARTRDERLNEKADEVLDLLKEMNYALRQITWEYRPATFEGSCLTRKANKLINWIETGDKEI